MHGGEPYLITRQGQNRGVNPNRLNRQLPERYDIDAGRQRPGVRSGINDKESLERQIGQGVPHQGRQTRCVSELELEAAHFPAMIPDQIQFGSRMGIDDLYLIDQPTSG